MQKNCLIIVVLKICKIFSFFLNLTILCKFTAIFACLMINGHLSFYFFASLTGLDTSLRLSSELVTSVQSFATFLQHQVEASRITPEAVTGVS